MSIQVNNLTINKSNRNLLKDISFSTNGEELIAIIGENGAGKSTLLHCLSGLEPSNHSITINGKLLESYSSLELAKLRSVLPQSNELAFPFIAKEVVRLGLSLSSLSIEQQDCIIDECLQLVDATSFSHKNYLYLSGGEKQRIQLARVLAQLNSHKKKNSYLLLDEPTSALDLKHQSIVLKQLKELTQSKVGVFIIVHDLNLASLYCDKILLLKKGSLINFDKPCNIIQQPLIEDAFETDVFIMNHPQNNSPLMINRLD